jgi:hypothetical protein
VASWASLGSCPALLRAMCSLLLYLPPQHSFSLSFSVFPPTCPSFSPPFHSLTISLYSIFLCFSCLKKKKRYPVNCTQISIFKDTETQNLTKFFNFKVPVPTNSIWKKDGQTTIICSCPKAPSSHKSLHTHWPGSLGSEIGWGWVNTSNKVPVWRHLVKETITDKITPPMRWSLIK